MGSWELSLARRRVILSPSFIKLHDLQDFEEGQELPLDSFLALFEPADRSALWLKISKAQRDEQPWEHEYQISGPQGEERRLYCLVAFVPGPQDAPRMLATVRDVTSQRRYLKQLRESEKYFRLVFENAKDYIFIKDINHNYTHVNPSMLQRYGISADQMIGHDAMAVFWGKSGEYVRKIDEKVLRGQEHRDEVTHSVLGKQITFDVLKSPIRNDQGEILGLIGIARDITENKARQLKLAAAEAMNRALLDCTTNGACLVDTQGTIIAFNEVWRQMYGRPEEEYLGRNFLDLLPRDLAKSRGEFFQRAVTENVTLRFQDQEDGWYYENIFHPIRGPGQGAREIAVYSHDITAQKLAEKDIQLNQHRLRSLAAELSLVEERERRRLSEILHDQIGQNLAFSLSRLKTLAEMTTNQRLLAGIEQLTDILGKTVKDTKSLTLQLSPPLLYDFGLYDALDWLGDDLYEKYGLPIKVFSDEESYSLDNDQKTICFQMVRELLLNVIKHAQARRAEVRLQREDDHLALEVWDDGDGFDTAILESGAREKLGFGLFNVRERLEYWGGSFHIASEPGSGTTVRLLLRLTN